MNRRRNLGPAKATWSLLASVVAHVGAISAAGWIAYHLAHREPRANDSKTPVQDDAIAVELPSVAEGALVADREEVPEGTPPSAHGGATTARMDTGTPGRGGTEAGERAVNLAASDDGMRLDPDPMSRLERDQHQRLHTKPWRTSREDRRMTTHPMELTFLATGTGEHEERRPSAAIDPSRGSLVSPRPSVRGGHVGGRETEEHDGPGASAGASQRGQLYASPGAGVRDGQAGADHRDAARIAKGRPDVAEGPTTIPSIYRGRPNDNVDSDQEVASTVRSLVHASVAGAHLAGHGPGGTAGPASDPGAGGAAGRGSISRAMGSGDGDVFDWNTTDPNWMPYFRKLHSKIDPLWANAFPYEAKVALKQGTVILMVTIAADGSARVAWPPVRPSGIDEFDRNCADAVRHAMPFEPLPASLGKTSIQVRMPFDAKNPIVK